MPKRAKRANAKSVNKSDFIRKHMSLPVAELVSKAKASGLSISPQLVYKVRGRTGTRGGAAAAPKKRGRKPGMTGQEIAFRRLVLELGVARSRTLVGEVERKLAALVASL